jgi:hypothetical protein
MGRTAILWPWLERIHPKRARVPSLDVIVIRVPAEEDKAVLIDMDPDVFFTEPHYDGYPAIQARLGAIDPDLLGRLLADAREVALARNRRRRRTAR